MDIKFDEFVAKFLQCIHCGGTLYLSGDVAICESCAYEFKILDGDIPSILPEGVSADISSIKWNELHGNREYWNVVEERHRDVYMKEVLPQLMEAFEGARSGGKVFLEIGCGQSYVGQNLACDGWFFIGIDFSIEALLASKRRLAASGIKNFFLIHGDIRALPFRDEIVDLAYGGGVIEHFPDTQSAVDHLYRVLRPGGVVMNTVPFLNLGNILYRSVLWGGIPNIFPLNKLVYIIHGVLLKGKYMQFGYELQFSKRQLQAIHKKAGFSLKDVSIKRYECEIMLSYIPMALLRRILISLAENSRFFWPMVKIVARKQVS